MNDIAYALKLYEKGHIEKAKKSCLKILKKEPNNYNANYLVGIIYQLLNKYQKSESFIKKAIQANPEIADIYFQLANVQREQNKIDEAIANYKKATELNPNYAEAYSNLGGLLHQKQHYNEAITSYKKAIDINPGHVSAYSNLGVTLRKLGEYDQAISNYKKALLLNPSNANTHFNLGNLFNEQSNYEEAISAYNNALKHNPNYVEAYSNLGNIHKDMNNFDQAKKFYEKALEINPNYIEAYTNLGSLYHELGQYEQAIDIFEAIIEKNPDNEEVYCNLGGTLHECGYIEEAIIYYEKALEINPDYADAHANYAFVLLSKLEFEKGWRKYKYRHIKKSKDKDKALKQLKASNKIDSNQLEFKNKVVYLRHEQGFGDMFMSSRFIQYLLDKNAKVIVYLNRHPQLHKLFKLSFPNAQFITEPLEEHCDYSIPMMDTAGVLGINQNNMPFTSSYLKCDIELQNKYKKKYFDNDQFKIGIVWAGGKSYGNNKIRSLHLNEFIENFKLPENCQLYSFQKDLSDNDKQLLDQHNITDIGQYMDDFLDTASLLKNLDVLISVDTAQAHLASALGLKTLILLSSYQIEWRWGVCKKSKTSYWYDATELIWQIEKGNWHSIFNNLNRRVNELSKK
ncbi:tetratricopeptide repeat protein [Thiotrichales bacterium 19X7-9]|nr:tetratricopeptide repeat protein [Thiotrichales bacterium 19X7-9]